MWVTVGDACSRPDECIPGRKESGELELQC